MTPSSSHLPRSFNLEVDGPVWRIAINAANARSALVRGWPGVPPRVHAIETILAQTRPRNVRELVPEAVVGLEESTLQAHVNTEARASCIRILMTSSSTGLLPVAMALEVLLGADIHASLALKRVAGNPSIWGNCAALG